MLKLTKWISLRLPPSINGEYECIYSKRDLGTVESFRANFANGVWRDLFGRSLPGLNEYPENFNWRGLASDPKASKP
jgi:hypothetical protein